MNRLPFSNGHGRFSDLAIICRQAKTLVVKCAGQEFSDFIVTESAGQVVVEVNAPTPWVVPAGAFSEEDIATIQSQPPGSVEVVQPKRRGRPPKVTT